jgi:hypothetical protein
MARLEVFMISPRGTRSASHEALPLLRLYTCLEPKPRRCSFGPPPPRRPTLRQRVAGTTWWPRGPWSNVSNPSRFRRGMVQGARTRPVAEATRSPNRCTSGRQSVERSHTRLGGTRTYWTPARRPASDLTSSSRWRPLHQPFAHRTGWSSRCSSGLWSDPQLRG